MVNSKEMEHRRMQIPHVDGVLDHVVAEVVGLAVVQAALDPATGEPSLKTTGMVVATVIVAGDIALAKDGPSEFPDKHNQGVLEKPT